MCIDILEIWFGNSNGQIYAILTKLSACQYSGGILSFNMFNIFNIESKKSALSGAKAGTINRIMDYLIDKFHKNNYHYRLANNRSYDFVFVTLLYLRLVFRHLAG